MSNVHIRIRDYFQSISENLKSDRTASRVFRNNADAGSTREDVLLEFLSQHVPARCHAIKGGFIFDVEGRESSQIDLIVTNDITLQFKRFDTGDGSGKSFNVIEGCYAAISVKTMLDKHGLFDALSNIASIPDMPDPGMRLNPMGPSKSDFMNHPYKAIFAFEGIGYGNLISNITEFYSAKSIPQNRRPDLIIVNNQYLVVHLMSDGQLSDGTVVPRYSFFPLLPRFVGGYALVYLVTQIQQAANYGSSILMDFRPYVDAIPWEE